MNKQEFLRQLRSGLSGLPQQDLAEALNFYREMIDDRMEEGLSEEAAVAAVGPVEDIITQVMAVAWQANNAKHTKTTKRRFTVWEILLLVLGSPIWLSLGIAAAAVVFSLYISAWAVIGALWSVFGSLVACGFAGWIAGVVMICVGHGPTGIAMLGAGSLCLGLSIFTFYGCKAITGSMVVLTKGFFVRIANRGKKKEAAQ